MGSNDVSTKQDRNVQHVTHAHQFGFFVALGMTVDYCLGAGFLGIPYAFYRSGLIIGLAIIISTTLLANMSKDLVVEAMNRASSLWQHPKLAEIAQRAVPHFTITNFKPKAEVSVENTTDHQEFVSNEEYAKDDSIESNTIVRMDNTQEQNTFANADAYKVSKLPWHKFELPDLCAFFAGNIARPAYTLTFSLYMYGSLWSYATVFSASLSANVPLVFMEEQTCDPGKHACTGHILFWIAVYAAIAIPLACSELKDQVIVQIAMFTARVVVIFMLVFTVFAAMGCDGTAFRPVPPGRASADTPLADFGGLAAIIPVALYAQIYHHSIPVLAEPVRDKRLLKKIFLASFWMMGIFYVLLGVSIPIYFGHHTERQCNLNWSQYVGCSKDANPEASGWAKFVSSIVLIFPALDVLSAYPLNAITLGNNLMSVFHGEAASAYQNLSNSEEQIRQKKSCNWLRNKFSNINWTKIFYRLCASVPPMIGGAIVHDLDTILEFTGVVGVAIVMLIPVLLHIQSTRFCVRVSRLLLEETDGSSYSHNVNQTSLHLKSSSVSTPLVHTSTWKEFGQALWSMWSLPCGSRAERIDPYASADTLVKELRAAQDKHHMRLTAANPMALSSSDSRTVNISTRDEPHSDKMQNDKVGTLILQGAAGSSVGSNIVSPALSSHDAISKAETVGTADSPLLVADIVFDANEMTKELDARANLIRSGLMPPGADEYEIMHALIKTTYTQRFARWSFLVPILLVIAVAAMAFVFVQSILETAS